MRYTYDLNTHGCLVLYADLKDRKRIREIIKAHGCDKCSRCEAEALEPLIANAELDWIQAEEIAALTDAPIIGFRDKDGEPEASWGFMDYQVRSFLDDLMRTGKAVFIS